MRKIASLVLLPFLLIPVYAEEELNCLIDIDANILGNHNISSYNWRRAFVEGNAPQRGRDDIEYEGDKDIEVHGMRRYYPHGEKPLDWGYGSVYNYFWKGWPRPKIRLEIHHGDWYKEYLEDGETLTREVIANQAKEALSRMPHLLMNSLPPSIVWQISSYFSGGRFLGKKSYKALEESMIITSVNITPDQVGRLENTLLHEFAHAIDHHYDIIGPYHRPELAKGFWEKIHYDYGHSYITDYASTNPSENFAESFVAWFAAQASLTGRNIAIDSIEFANKNCTLRDYIYQKAPLEMEWFDKEAAKASQSVSGRLFSK